MKLYSWNVNGIRAVLKKDLFLPFIEKHQPDILCLMETKAEQGQAEIDLPDYTEVWSSARKKGYSGTAIFSKTPPIASWSGFTEGIANKHGIADDGYGDPADEGRVTTAEFEKFYVVAVYTPNSKGDLSRLGLRHKQWDPGFLEYITSLEAKKPVIFCGDLNVAHTEDDLANPKPNVGKHGFTDEEREGFDKILKAGYIDSFRIYTKGNGHYTWWTHWANARARNVGWRIDYVMVSNKLKSYVTNAEIHANVMGSDHCPVSVTLNLEASVQ